MKMNEGNFLITKQYKLFEEFCNACRREKYIGLCHGAPGVGKTLSARYYSEWDLIESFKFSNLSNLNMPVSVKNCRTVFYTAEVVNTPLRLRKDIIMSSYKLINNVAAAHYQEGVSTNKSIDELEYEKIRLKLTREVFNHVDLIIVDEADRLKLSCIEQLRSYYDENQCGIILIGMPGLERRLSRYAQLYSRVGFVHSYKNLSMEEIVFVMQNHLKKFQININSSDFTDNETINAIVAVSRGNFRLVIRLLKQIERIMKINNFKTITKELVDSAKKCLLIGSD